MVIDLLISRSGGKWGGLGGGGGGKTKLISIGVKVLITNRII